MSRRFVAASLVVVAFGGCGRGAATLTSPEITLHASASPAEPAYVEVTGLSSGDLSRLRASRWSVDQWQSLLKITVAQNRSANSLPPVQGAYSVTGVAIRFVPLFPFDPGRAYRVAFDPGRLPRPQQGSIVTTVVSLPARVTTPTTVVTAVHPSAGVVPENLLRMYIEFSAPMGNGVAREFVRILDDAGHEVAIPFLPVDADFWNPDHTRCTVFFDPGRVKQGILPNKEIGRPLRAGHKYVLEISTDWHDANGQPLKTAYRREFRVGPADEQAIKLSSWRIKPPGPGTREPLVVDFGKPLDHGLLARALIVETKDRRPFEGEISLEANDTRWVFTPYSAWQNSAYDLVASSILEDPAGNQIQKPFEAVGNAAGREADEYRVSFTVGGAPAGKP